MSRESRRLDNIFAPGLSALLDGENLDLAVAHQDDVARGFLHVFRAFLHLWQRRDFGASLDRLLERMNAR